MPAGRLPGAPDLRRQSFTGGHIVAQRTKSRRRRKTAAMTAAFEEALKRLNVADREAPMATSVAKKIVRLAKRGERNPTRLTEGVISSFRVNPIPM